MDSLFGFLNIDKPIGMTSHDVVSRLRRITKIKQIGHTGTLDPLASGALPVCVGKSTRLIEYLDDDKEYIATVQFGQNTDTYDKEGNITEVFEKKISQEELCETLKTFIGDILQYPPKYSAIKVKGKKLYEYARNNQDVEIKPRQINISKISLLSFDEDKQQAQIQIACSKGTYIRSIAYDIGQKLKCGGHLIGLRRTKAGKFSIENSVKLDDIKELSDICSAIINPIEILGYPKYKLTEEQYKKVINGNGYRDENIIDSDIVILIYGDRIKSIASATNNIVSVRKVL